MSSLSRAIFLAGLLLPLLAVCTRVPIEGDRRTGQVEGERRTVQPPGEAEAKLGGAQYEDEFLRAVVMSASQDETGQLIGISVLVDNISHENIYLAYKGGGDNATAVDDRGNVYSGYKISGVNDMGPPQREWSGAPQYRLPQQQDFSIFSPGASHTIVFAFQRKQSPNRARSVSFAANFWFATESQKLRNFSLGIPNIALLQ